MRTGSALLTNAVGLHARPSVKLTQLAKSFTGTVEFSLSPDGPWTDAKSPVKVMRVRAGKGEMLHVRTEGPDAEAALEAVIGLIRRQFDEH
jgi:phosphocarrier protein HPr